MKKGIHPKYAKVEVSCLCGKVHEIMSPVGEIAKLENCSNCHPRYTGKKQEIQVKGRMEKFLEKQKRMEALKAGKAA